MSYSRLRRPFAAATLTSLVAASLTTVALAAPADAAEGDVTINLLLTNDFHGRINDDTVRWAWNVENLRQTTPADGGLFVGAGDLIGASQFASAVDDDQPTIDVMNAMGLDASAVGNHEFDQGWADLRDDVLEEGLPGSDDDRQAEDEPAAWEYLGANVYEKGTTDPVLREYYTADIGGVTVAVVGAVTGETASLVSPAGIADLDFGDPIDAVNRVAGELSDGDDANGEADVIVATFHSGAQVGEGSNYDDEVAKGGEFAEMANLDPAVNVVFNGHTHQTYAWSAPAPEGSDYPTRPFLQTGSYAANVGQVVLTYNTIADKVTNYTVANHATPPAPDEDNPGQPTNDELVAQYPDPLTQVNQIVTDALDYATEIGNQPVGTITDDITTAYQGGSYGRDGYAPGNPADPTEGRDQRGLESTMGHTVADMLRETPIDGQPTPDLGITNPGGLRAELFYEGDTSTNPENTDGVVTYAEANTVLPFVNNISYVDVTGATLKKILEQQWQPEGASRPFLALGVSRNVHVTLDPDRPAGERVRSVTVNGKRVRGDQHYLVSTFSFLAAGGDNFTAFTDGTATDTGKIDRELWIDGFFGNGEAKSPDYARRMVYTDAPKRVTEHQKVDFELNKLDLTSLGSPANSSVRAVLVQPGKNRTLETFPVTYGKAFVEMRVPRRVPRGAELRFVAEPSGTRIDIPIRQVRRHDSSMDVRHRPARVVEDQTRVRLIPTVTTDGHAAHGKVRVRAGGHTYTKRLDDGRARFVLHRFHNNGVKTVRVRYLGSWNTEPVVDVLRLRVRRH